MSDLLFFVQQLAQPIWGYWPIWLVYGVSYLWLKSSKFRGYSIWILRLSVGTLLLLVLIRLLLLIAYPYASRIVNIPYVSAEMSGIPLHVSFRYGELNVTHQAASSQFTLESYDVREGYAFGKKNITSIKNGQKNDTPSFSLAESNSASTLTKFWSRAELVVPTEFMEPESYVITEARTIIDLTNSESSNFNFLVLMSDIQLKLPKTKGEKYIEIQLESSSGKFYVPDGPTYIFVLNSPLRIEYPSEFEKVDYRTYERKGSSGTVVVNINSRAPRTLEVIPVSEHNK